MFWSFCAAVTRGSVEYDAGLPDAGVDEPHVAVEVCVLFSCPDSGELVASGVARVGAHGSVRVGGHAVRHVEGDLSG